jgi:hypothetical protein
VNRLADREARYQDVTIQLMLEIAALTRFPDIERLEEPDRTIRLDEARDAVARMKSLSEQFASKVAEREDAERVAYAARAATFRQFGDDLADLKRRFLDLHAATETQKRGYAFETFLSDLFKIFDMEPRLAYSTDLEQIDGSLTFDTDDYIVEAKWVSGTVSRETADAFAAKVRRKGKNALGLLVAVNGFSKPAVRAYEQETPFLTMDGMDVFSVLDGRLRLDDLLRAKKRHANETGSCYHPASAMIR